MNDETATANLMFTSTARPPQRVARIYGGTSEIMKELIGRSLG